MKNYVEDKQTDVLQKASVTYDLIDDSLGMFVFFFVATVIVLHKLTLYVVSNV